MSQQKPEIPANETNDELALAIEYLQKIETIVGSEEFSSVEMMNEIVILADSWAAEQSEAVDAAQVMEMAAKEPEEDADERALRVQSYSLSKKVTEALFASAQEDYFKEHDLSDMKWSKLSFVEQLTHRTGIKKLHEEYLKNEVRSITKSKLGSGPFHALADTDEPTDAQIQKVRNEWLEEQVTGLQDQLEIIENELSHLERQKNLPRVSTTLLQANQGRKAELEVEKHKLNRQLNVYLKRLNGGSDE